MSRPIPNPSIIQTLGLRVVHVERGARVWTDSKRLRYDTWDSLHGEFELFTNRGCHPGALDPVTGALVKEAVKGRRIRV